MSEIRKINKGDCYSNLCSLFEADPHKALINIKTGEVNFSSTEERTNHYSKLASLFLDTTYSAHRLAINIDAIELDFIPYDSMKLFDANDRSGVQFKNLYTYVLTQMIYVPYYQWIYKDHFVFDNVVYLFDTKSGNVDNMSVEDWKGYRLWQAEERRAKAKENMEKLINAKPKITSKVFFNTNKSKKSHFSNFKVQRGRR